jgi:hypothetical protein
MTSSDELKELAVRHTYDRMNNFFSSPLKEKAFLDAAICQMIALDGQERTEDILPQLIHHSANSRVIFRALQRIAAGMINKNQELPAELKSWLIETLNHYKSEPKNGRTGPNKSILEQSFLIGAVNTVRNITGIPIWPRFTQEQHGSAISLVALASARFKNAHSYSPFPITTSALEARYVQARKTILGKSVQKT